MNFLLTKCLSLQIPVQEKHDKTTMIWQELYFAWLLQPATYVASCFKQTNRRLLELPKMPLPLFVCACERLGALGSRGAFFFTIQVSLATKMRKKKPPFSRSFPSSPFFSGHYLARDLFEEPVEEAGYVDTNRYDLYCRSNVQIYVKLTGLPTPHDREGLIDDVITYDTWRHLRKKYSLTPIITNLRWHKTREKDVVGIITFKLIGFLPTNHIIAYITMTSRSLWENLLF